MKRPNPLLPDHLTPTERRRELCCLLALGLIRLHMRTVVDEERAQEQVLLHSLADQSGHATPTTKEKA